MQRFTISLDDALAQQFDTLIGERGYVNRSEAVRDLIRGQISQRFLNADQAKWCVATISYVYDHHDHVIVSRLAGLQHDHHEITVSSSHIHLDHAHCLETLVLRGSSGAVLDCAQQLVALRGVHYGNVHVIPLVEGQRKHAHPGQGVAPHMHLKPIS